MGHRVLSWISILLTVGLFVGADCAAASAQTSKSAAGDPVVQRRCTTVALTSDTSLLPVRLIEPYLQQDASFQASKMVLVDEQASADAFVHLTSSGERDTRIDVTNRIADRHASTISLWTDYPGMIASAVMEQLRSACPGAVLPRAEPPRAVAECRKPAAELRTIATIAGCSQTSWMDNRDIYNTLESRAELKQWPVRVLPACEDADVVLNVTHNLDLTVEWSWTLRSHEGNTISSGRVIAFDSPTAAQRITDEVAHEIARARAEKLEIAEHVPQHAYESVSIRNLHANLLRSDFSLLNSRISLSVDNETVMARDAGGNVAFAFLLQELLDVRRRKGWDHPLQLPEPTGLVTLLETAATDREVIAATVALAIYATVAVPPAQVRTPVHIVDLAWQERGAVKTVSLQVSGHDSRRLLRALHPAGFSGQEQTCGSSLMVATSQR